MIDALKAQSCLIWLNLHNQENSSSIDENRELLSPPVSVEA